MSYHNHKEFVCPRCNKDFKKKRQLKNHTKGAHNFDYKDYEEETAICLSLGQLDLSRMNNETKKNS